MKLSVRKLAKYRQLIVLTCLMVCLSVGLRTLANSLLMLSNQDTSFSLALEIDDNDHNLTPTTEDAIARSLLPNHEAEFWRLTGDDKQRPYARVYPEALIRPPEILSALF